ncbi:hypothetical protein BDQ12DRAFT_593650, partial [Crucibulum laeve]
MFTERGESLVHSSNPYKLVNEFYDANSELLNSRSRNIADSNVDFKNIEDSLNGFTESAQVLIKGLHALRQLHPFIGVAVGAFALVITLDLSRRENDRKVLAVKVQMQDLMMVFFELRHVKHPKERGPDGMTISERLKSLMLTIAKDVKSCGSACDAYLKKGFLAKTVKASVYETRLADFGTLFVDHRKKLELSLALHTSLGVDAANEKLDSQKHHLEAIEEKLDMILLFRKLDTPRERDVHKFIEEHGGVKTCIYDDELLEELILKSGESLSRISGRDARKSNDLPDIRKRLSKELQEDIDEAFNRNMVLFERKLEMQSKQLTETVQQESDHIINTLLAGAHDRIIDPDLQKIWKDMGWKGSVKARHFVLALHDYYTDRLNSTDTPTVDRSSLSPLPSPLPSKFSPSTPRRRQDDRWALSYINAAYVQPILEAVDDDGTGFVSVKEVNDFVASRPDGWSLPHWIAYWAVGWQVSISQYKNKIYSLVQTMFSTLEHVLPSNRRAVDEYLFHTSFWRIELILRSTRSVNPKILSDPDLSRITESYARSEEERLESNLQDVSYELDTPATVSLITGVGRIERYVYPLLFLLLRRHLKVITLACKHVLDTEEFVLLNDSLVSILLAVDYRIQNLEAIFKQTHMDVQSRLGNFAFGLLSYGDVKRVPIQNSFGTWLNDDETGTTRKETLSRIDVLGLIYDIPLEILKYGIQDGYHSTDYFEFEPQRLRTSHPIQGTWTGHYSKREGIKDMSFLVRLSIRMLPSRNKIIGKGEDFSTAFDFEGNVSPAKNNRIGFVFSLTDDNDGMVRSCNGFLDTDTDIITASWTDRKKKDAPDEIDYQPFCLRRISPSLVRYRYTDRQFSEDPVRSRWSFACDAALHLAQEKLWARRFFEARFTERKRFVELTIRSLIVEQGLTPQRPLNTSETAELEYLRRDLNPSEARFYQALAQFEIQKLPWHPSWGCDWCERRITKCRILCINCISEDLSDNIDLCASCMDKAPSKRGFTHEVSHGMIKVEQTIHDHDLARTTEASRATIDRIKALFRTIEVATIHEGDRTHVPDGLPVSEHVCACCEKHVLPPCWACVVCTRDTFVCLECDLKRAPALPVGPSPGHTLSHPLVRIRDTSISGPNATAEERLASLEQRMISLEFKVSEGLAAI